MSGDEKKQVALASVPSLHLDMWLLDEPSASLDPRSQSRLRDFTSELMHEGKTIITAAHNLDTVEEIADRVVMFCVKHKISNDSAPRELLSD